LHRIVGLISFAEWIDRHGGVSAEAPACLAPQGDDDAAATPDLPRSHEHPGLRRARMKERVGGWLRRACRRFAPPRLAKVK